MKLISNCSGKIKRVLLVDRNEISKDRDADEILEQFLPLIREMVKNSNDRLTFEILVQHKFRIPEILPPDGLLDPVGIINDKNEFLIAEGPAVRDENEYHYAELRHRVKKLDSGEKFNYRLIRPNIDFLFVIREILGSFPKGGESQGGTLPVWIRDPFLVLRNEDGSPVFLEPYHSWTRPNGGLRLLASRFVPEIVSSQLGIPIRAEPFFLHGGNILAADDFVIVNDVIFETNHSFFREKLSTANRQRFYPTLARILGFETDQCIHIEDKIPTDLKPEKVQAAFYHIDLFVTLVGKSTTRSPLILIGEIYDWAEGAWKIAPDSDPFQAYLDKYAEILSRKLRMTDIMIQRLPLIRHKGEFLSYNNCLVEIESESHRIAYIPKFSWPFLDDNIQYPDPKDKPNFKGMDEKVVTTFSNHGIIAIPIDLGFRVLASGHAGLDCMVSVLERA